MDKGKKAWVSNVDETVRKILFDMTVKSINSIHFGLSENIKPEIEFGIELMFYFTFIKAQNWTPGMKIFNLTFDKDKIRFKQLLIYLTFCWAIQRAKCVTIIQGINHIIN
jgi:hypothetical protein